MEKLNLDQLDLVEMNEQELLENEGEGSIKDGLIGWAIGKIMDGVLYYGPAVYSAKPARTSELDGYDSWM
ncbi:MAG: hypothetical protein MUE85_11660 [Microscillaceae bacterium]|jgi:hypothetical protein|nr:hypothetical protein [Microscillaceae bacterium]